MTKYPKWAIVLKELYLATQSGKGLLAAYLSTKYPFGYAERNCLGKSNTLEGRLGIKLNRERVDGSAVKRYSIKPDSMALAYAILKKYNLI